MDCKTITLRTRVLKHGMLGFYLDFYPGVGSLFVERRGARRLSKRSVQPPCRVVSFSSQQQGVSLADELARTLHCDAAGAQDVYDRWLSRTREGDVLFLSIDTLKGK